jgi:hypothetical protein
MPVASGMIIDSLAAGATPISHPHHYGSERYAIERMNKEHIEG